VARARVFTKIWLALFGQYPWSGVPSMPPELVYLPPNAPFNLYDFACWARGTIAPEGSPILPANACQQDAAVPGAPRQTKLPSSALVGLVVMIAGRCS